MRIWSLHPKYLDAKGLVALWQETLLAKNVLEGNTKGYRHHPQLIRFKQSGNPLFAINQYLSEVHNEATKRGYNFNREKINWDFLPATINVTSGQVEYEKEHLLRKLKIRDPEKFEEVIKVEKIEVHPIFNIIQGEVEDWEVV